VTPHTLTFTHLSLLHTKLMQTTQTHSLPACRFCFVVCLLGSSRVEQCVANARALPSQL
jgi:hypothetical protein